MLPVPVPERAPRSSRQRSGSLTPPELVLAVTRCLCKSRNTMCSLSLALSHSLGYSRVHTHTASLYLPSLVSPGLPVRYVTPHGVRSLRGCCAAMLNRGFRQCLCTVYMHITVSVYLNCDAALRYNKRYYVPREITYILTSAIFIFIFTWVHM